MSSNKVLPLSSSAQFSILLCDAGWVGLGLCTAHFCFDSQLGSANRGRQREPTGLNGGRKGVASFPSAGRSGSHPSKSSSFLKWQLNLVCSFSNTCHISPPPNPPRHLLCAVLRNLGFLRPLLQAQRHQRQLSSLFSSEI